MEEKKEEQPQAEPIPWTVMDMVKGIGLVIGLTIILSVGLGIATSLLIGSDAYPDLDLQYTNITQLIEEFFDLLASKGLLQQWLIIAFAGMVVGEGAMVFGAWRFSAFKYRLGWRALGFRSFNVRRGLTLVAIVVLGGLLINILYDMLMTSLWEEPTSSVILEFTDSGLGLATIAILAVVAAPIAEEVFFRGFLFSGIGRRYGYGWGAVASALLFSIAHVMQPGAFLPIFLLGLLLAWLYMRTGSIWACITAHFAYNSIALLFMILYQQ
jgi:membrane protease YdiL (CAAX protease family)